MSEASDRRGSLCPLCSWFLEINGVSSIAVGTMTGFAVFIYAGQYLLRTFHEKQLIINCTLGSILLLAAFMQVKKMIRLPSAIYQARIFKQ